MHIRDACLECSRYGFGMGRRAVTRLCQSVQPFAPVDAGPPTRPCCRAYAVTDTAPWRCGHEDPVQGNRAQRAGGPYHRMPSGHGSTAPTATASRHHPARSQPRTSMTAGEKLKAWARRIKRDGVTLWFACKSPQTPWYGRACSH